MYPLLYTAPTRLLRINLILRVFVMGYLLLYTSSKKPFVFTAFSGFLVALYFLRVDKRGSAHLSADIQEFHFELKIVWSDSIDIFRFG